MRATRKTSRNIMMYKFNFTGSEEEIKHLYEKLNELSTKKEYVGNPMFNNRSLYGVSKFFGFYKEETYCTQSNFSDVTMKAPDSIVLFMFRYNYRNITDAWDKVCGLYKTIQYTFEEF